MRISIEARPTDFEPAVDWISRFIGAAVDKRVTAFERQEKANPLLTRHFTENYSLEFALAQARRYRRSTGRLPRGDEYDELYGFLVPAQRIHKLLPPTVQSTFEGRLRNAVSSPYGFRPFAYEIAIATHLMSKGWDVELADYAGIAQFDFLARRDGIEIEVECKTTSGDTGRKIHRQEVNRLADLLLPSTQQLADIKGCHLLSITIPDRLGKSNEELARISSAVAAVAQQRASSSSELAIAYAFEDLASWPQPDRDPDAIAFFEKKFAKTNSHLLFHERPNFSIVAVMITSSAPDSVVRTISDQAKEAADQCSGARAALIAMQLIDPIDRPELEPMLKTSNGMHAIAHAIFRGDTRLHVDSIAFTFPQDARLDGLGTKSLGGSVLMLNNPSPQFSCPELRSIFRQ